jgi:hypothetical protein
MQKDVRPAIAVEVRHGFDGIRWDPRSEADPADRALGIQVPYADLARRVVIQQEVRHAIAVEVIGHAGWWWLLATGRWCWWRRLGLSRTTEAHEEKP